MADLKEEVADFGEKAIGFASNLFKRGTEVARQQARIVGLQTQVVRLREDKARLYSLMGQKVYALFEKGLVKNADLLALCEQARDMDQQVESAEAEIEQLRTGSEMRTEVQDMEGGIEAEPTGAAPAATEAPDTTATSTPPSSTTTGGDLSWLPPVAPEPEPPKTES
jgi:hypothetical protein